MKVYVEGVSGDFAINRVVLALKRYVPVGAEVTLTEGEADFFVYHVNGRLHHLKRQIRKHQKPYAIMQYVLRKSLNPDTGDWLDIWHNARAVWGFFDLAELAREDGNIPSFNFYHAPLGVDSDVFRPLPKTHKYLICSTGRDYLQESVREIAIAARTAGRPSAHLGCQLDAKLGIDCYYQISDEELVRLYNDCDYISGLRRVEGFELPAAEGLLCGVRPIVYDSPHYRKWYDGLAEFIPETNRTGIIEDLVKLFRGDIRAVTWAEIAEARGRFDWESLVQQFWGMCL